MVSAKTNTRGRMALVASPEPADGRKAALHESIDPKASLVKRLWRIEQELGAVEKSQTATIKGDGGSYSYKFSGHDVIIAAVNPLLGKHGVKLLPSTVAHERTGNMTVLTVRVEFVNVDNDDDRCAVEVVNYGADKGDKGASKAFTNCVREGIKKALNITSVEDDRANETTAYEPAEGATRADLDAAKENARAAIEQWAKAFKMGLERASDIKDVQRLERENRDQLANETLPEVTRTFFIELIQTRKAALSQ